MAAPSRTARRSPIPRLSSCSAIVRSWPSEGIHRPGTERAGSGALVVSYLVMPAKARIHLFLAGGSIRLNCLFKAHSMKISANPLLAAVAPPPKALTDHLASVVGEAATARYTDVPGLPPLRAALAADMGKFYGARIAASDVSITAGCNQAFCLAIMALAAAGDDVILPLPYYFNHQMWLACRASARAICPSGPSATASPIRPKRRGSSGRVREPSCW